MIRKILEMCNVENFPAITFPILTILIMRRVFDSKDDFYSEMEIWDMWKNDLHAHGSSGWKRTNRLILLPIYHNMLMIGTKICETLIYVENAGIPLSEWFLNQRKKAWTPDTQKLVYVFALYILHAVRWMEHFGWVHEDIGENTIYVLNNDPTVTVARILVNRHMSKGSMEECYIAHRKALHDIFGRLKLHIIGSEVMRSSWGDLMDMILYEKDLQVIIAKLHQIGGDEKYTDIQVTPDQSPRMELCNHPLPQRCCNVV